ncbi:hypothetical protein TVAGG3_0128540 [Trichomonas vaginalis G3]|uniref:hypothetical protein n=1 Tax=Trichomonas vaginalis (strain ATCC PRA-98 / G3) TaxID=412133 RepID=UPI0021E54B0E|nr:hypothetical protein TVAGG3_0128540 [Trichomonas vaginalis G3]KAI5545936.1 hypothetical protein TVAGG3_0128540 [Trichomonas vaginalis G3]
MQPYKGYVDKVYLIAISNLLETGRMKWEEACTHVPIRPELASNIITYQDVSKTYLKDQFTRQGLPIPKSKRGRREIPYDQNKSLMVISDHWAFPCGQAKQYQRLRLQGNDISYREVQKYFRLNNYTRTLVAHVGPETALRYWALSPI